MKKKLISILMCAMIGTTVIGCGSSDKDGSKEARPKARRTGKARRRLLTRISVSR